MLLDLLHRYVRGRYRSLGFKSFALETRSTRLHYLIREPPGSTRTVVLVHGLGTSSSTWLKILPHVKESVRIVAPDLPGFGFSTVRGEKGYCSVGEHEEVLSFLVDNIAQGPVTLLGQSFGGWISALYAARHPKRVAHLILVNTAGVYYRGVEKLREMFTVSSVKETRRLLDSLWYRYPWYFRPFAGSVFRELSKRRMSDLVRSIDATDFLAEELGALTMPVSIIWGMEDRVISSESVNVLQKFVPRAKFFPIDRCGHVPQLERPAEFVSILHHLLQD